MAVTSMANSSIRDIQKRNTFAGQLPPVGVDFFVIAGGGGGASRDSTSGDQGGGGGGGAGGYRLSFTGETSGGNSTAETTVLLSGEYKITLGAGGAGSPLTSKNGSRGLESVFGPIISVGGGGGIGFATDNAEKDGGSGGGNARFTGRQGIGFTSDFDSLTGEQGSDGGQITSTATGGAGGGGAGANGSGFSSGNNGGAGGAGLTNSLSGSSVARAGGGGGGAYSGGSGGSASAGGGAGGNPGVSGSNGTLNTGGGGGGGGGLSSTTQTAGGNGGSGLIIFELPDNYPVQFSVGVTSTFSTAGGKTKYIVTATSTTDETVTIG